MSVDETSPEAWYSMPIKMRLYPTIANRTKARIRVNVFMIALSLLESFSKRISIYTCPRSNDTLGIVKPMTIASVKDTNS